MCLTSKYQNVNIIEHEIWHINWYIYNSINKLICISVIIHNPVMLAITSLSKIRSPKYLRFSL